MCVQCPIIRIRDMDPKRSRQEKTIGIRNEMLPTSSKILIGKIWIRNEDIRKMISKEETIIDIIKKRKLRLFGHICRMDDSRLVKHLIFGKMDGKSRRGRPCREWLDDITEWCQRSGHDLFHLAQDRRAWRNLIP